MNRTVYLISGPAGVGKSTTARKIAESLPKSAYIEGDLINHMVIGGYEKPWISDFHLNLIWRNIAALTRNFVETGHDVVIDYVAFYDKAEVLRRELQDYDVMIKYAVLIVDSQELLLRDSQRKPEVQMGARCLEGLKEILESKPPAEKILDTTNISVEEVVREIMTSPRFEV